MLTESEVKKHINQVYLENKGTATSGWWNPDHAARVALGQSSLIDGLSGDGAKFAVALISNKALDNAVHNTYRVDSPRIEGSTYLNRKLIEIGHRSLDVKDAKLDSKRTVTNDNLNSLLKMTNAINFTAGALSEYASSDALGERPKKYTIAEIQSSIRTLRKMAKSYERNYRGLYYKDSSGKRTAAKKIIDSTINKLDDYTEDMHHLFRYNSVN